MFERKRANQPSIESLFPGVSWETLSCFNVEQGKIMISLGAQPLPGGRVSWAGQEMEISKLVEYYYVYCAQNNLGYTATGEIDSGQVQEEESLPANKPAQNDQDQGGFLGGLFGRRQKQPFEQQEFNGEQSPYYSFDSNNRMFGFPGRQQYTPQRGDATVEYQRQEEERKRIKEGWRLVEDMKRQARLRPMIEKAGGKEMIINTWPDDLFEALMDRLYKLGAIDAMADFIEAREKLKTKNIRP